MTTVAVSYTDTELLDAIRAVALLAVPEAPETLSQPEFDRRRADVSDHYPGLPTARAIYMRLNSGSSGRVSWNSLVRAAVEGGAAIRQTVVAARRSSPGIPMSERVVFFALRVVAGELGSPSPAPDQYDATAGVLRRRRRGVLAKLLPTSGQLIQFAGGWDEALLLAQLQPRRRNAAPPSALSRPRGRPQAVAVPEAIALYVEHQGALPTKHDLRWFAKAAGFALADDAAKPWGGFLAEMRAAWLSLGHWCPNRPPRVAERQRYQPKPGDLPADLPARVRDRWADIDVCADALNSYWDTLPRGREPKQKGYGAWAVGKPYPAPSRFQQHGGFTTVRERARQKRRPRGRQP